MKRVTLGWLLILQALAHVSADMWISINDPVWFTTVLCAVVFAGYLGSGLALFRIPVLRDHWRAMLLVASLGAIVFIVWTRPAWGMLGVTIDVILFLVVLDVMRPRIDSSIAVFGVVGVNAAEQPTWLELGWAVGAVALAYGTLAILARPTLLHWGTSAAERESEIPGDDILPGNAFYRIDHGITIRASANSVCPWLVQLGQYRGGFYSYDRLERAVGDRIHNAEEINPACLQVTGIPPLALHPI